MALGLKSPLPTFDNRGMAPQTPPQVVAQRAAQADSEAVQRPGRQPFKMSALHPRAGKASSAGVAPDLLGELQGLLPGSLTSGIGHELGMVPKAKLAAAPAKGPNRTRKHKAKAVQHAPAGGEVQPKPAGRRMTAEEARAFLMGSEAPAAPRDEPRPRRTPPIPQSIRNLRLKGFTNVYELLPDEPRLFALESVYGRWDGQILVLDSAATHVQVVRSRLERKTLRPYCQHETACTYGLARLAFPLATRGILAGSVFGPMLTNIDDKWEKELRRDAVRKEIAPIIRFVIKSMPNLKAIVCLGATAYDYTHFAMTGKVAKIPKTPKQLDEHEPERPIFGGPTIFATCRTGIEAIRRRGGETKAVADWQAVADYLEHQERPRALHKIARARPARQIEAA